MIRPIESNQLHQPNDADDGPTCPIDWSKTMGGTVGQMVAEINIELPDEAVQRIAEATRAGSSQGAESGSRKGLKDQNRLAEREQALENRINI